MANPWVHYGPNPCNSTATHVDKEGGWADEETGRNDRVTCKYCKRKNKIPAKG